MKRKPIIFCFMVVAVAIAQEPAPTPISAKPLAENHRTEVWSHVGPVAKTVHASTKIAGRWRFCHDGREVTVAPWEASGETGSIYSIVECESLAHCLKVIEAKGLVIAADIQHQIDEASGIIRDPDHRVGDGRDQG